MTASATDSLRMSTDCEFNLDDEVVKNKSKDLTESVATETKTEVELTSDLISV